MTHTPRRAAFLRPATEGSAHFRVQRRDRAGSVLHEYHLVA
jgi:hypothetical protein